MKKPVLGILLGDAAGIGSELVAKLCAANKLSPYCRPVIIGDKRVMSQGMQFVGVNFPLQIIDDVGQAAWDEGVPFLDQRNLDPAGIELGKAGEVSGRAAGDMMVTALRLCQSGAIDGFVYAPVNKAALQYGGYPFEDEQKLMAHYLSWDGLCGEMNVLKNLWTSRVTSHVPLSEVSSLLSKERVLSALRLAAQTLRRAGFDTPKIAVSAFNPHAGESGLCGREEIDVIAPAVELARENSIDAYGPFPADTVFISAFNGDYDAVVTMYHDQGQIALKLMDFQSSVTVAAGFPYAIATPAHGTAFDIAGKGLAKTGATEQAVIIAAKMAARRYE